MTILLWLLPAALATLAAMVVVSRVGHAPSGRDRTEAEQERFAAAIAKPLPQARPRPVRVPARERSSGVAPRRSA